MALYENGILISGANTLPQMTLAEYQALPVSERPTYWERTDKDYAEYVSVTADGVKTWSALLDELFALTNQTKITKDSCVIIGTEYHRLTDLRGSYIDYSLAGLSGTSMLLVRLKLKSSSSSYEVLSPSYSDASNSVATNGVVLRLYY